MRSCLTADGLIHEYRVSRGEKGPLWIPMGIFLCFFFCQCHATYQTPDVSITSQCAARSATVMLLPGSNPHISNLWRCSFHPKLDGHHLKKCHVQILFYIICIHPGLHHVRYMSCILNHVSCIHYTPTLFVHCSGVLHWSKCPWLFSASRVDRSLFMSDNNLSYAAYSYWV